MRATAQVPAGTAQNLDCEAEMLDVRHHEHNYERSVIERGVEQWWRADAGGGGGGGGGGGENEIFSSPPLRVGRRGGWSSSMKML